jgi:hypothetical protein
VNVHAAHLQTAAQSLVGPGAAADAVAGLEQEDVKVPVAELSRSRHSGESAADHDDVSLACVAP